MTPTPRELATARFIRRWWLAHGTGPTLQAIAVGLGISKVTALEHVNNLRAKGIVAPAVKHRAYQIRIADGVDVPDDNVERVARVLEKKLSPWDAEAMAYAVLAELDPAKGGQP